MPVQDGITKQLVAMINVRLFYIFIQWLCVGGGRFWDVVLHCEVLLTSCSLV